MSDNLPNIELPINEWVDLYSLSGTTVGTALSIENVGVCDVYLAVQELKPDPDHEAYNIIKRNGPPLKNSVDDLGAWAFCNSKGGKVNAYPTDNAGFYPPVTARSFVDGKGKELFLEENGGVPVNVQDQHTEPLDAYFSKSVSIFTIAADTGVSGITAVSLVYTFEASPGHGITINPGTNEILLLDTIADHAFFAIALNVAGNVITVDRPIDHAFPSATALGRVVTTNMAVDGSVTPQIFSIRAGAIPVDSVRFIITMRGTSNMGEDTFGGLAPLPRGLVLRVVNSFQKTIFNFKVNQDIRQFCFDGIYPDKVPSGQHSFSARLTFGGQSKHGVVLRISGTDVIQWVVQDNLTGGGLTALRISDMGHETGD